MIFWKSKIKQFIRLVVSINNNVLKQLKLLENSSNKRAYEYEQNGIVNDKNFQN